MFRFGGDEFVLLLAGARPTQAAEVALRVVEGVGRRPFPGEPPLRVTVSMGVASLPEDAPDAAGLLAAADRRSYLAKRGRGCLVVDDTVRGVATASPRLLGRDAAMTAALAGVIVDLNPALAARMFGAADELRRRHHLPRPPVWQQEWDAKMKILDAALDPTARRTAWAAGEQAPLDQTIAAALALTADPTAPTG